MEKVKDVVLALKKFENVAKAAFLRGFFKTGPGDYAQGDLFWGINVPTSRAIAKKFANLPFSEIAILISSKIHEQRLTALLILVHRFEKATTQTEKAAIVEFYLTNRRFINNWDLVDLSAPNILGAWLVDHDDATILYYLANSKVLWERRIAMIATHAFIVSKRFEHTLRLSKMLLHDDQDLMHKAVGWMLREMGKRDEKPLIAFLDAHAHEMPRTMLRYSIERLDATSKKKYMTMKK